VEQAAEAREVLAEGAELPDEPESEET
jgi:hypothetical protein